jgi:lysophospholipase L1-like esterase
MDGVGVGYLDLWNLAPVAEFTNSPVHLNPAGSARLARRIAEALPEWVR